MEKFELNKCYRHSSGREIRICGTMNPLGFNTCFIAEEGGSLEFVPIAMNSKDATVGWKEISEEEFLKNNFSD